MFSPLATKVSNIICMLFMSTKHDDCLSLLQKSQYFVCFFFGCSKKKVFFVRNERNNHEYCFLLFKGVSWELNRWSYRQIFHTGSCYVYFFKWIWNGILNFLFCLVYKNWFVCCLFYCRLNGWKWCFYGYIQKFL